MVPYENKWNILIDIKAKNIIWTYKLQIIKTLLIYKHFIIFKISLVNLHSAVLTDWLLEFFSFKSEHECVNRSLQQGANEKWRNLDVKWGPLINLARLPPNRSVPQIWFSVGNNVVTKWKYKCAFKKRMFN